MKAFSLKSALLLGVSLICAVALAREFGPEWKKIQSSNPNDPRQIEIYQRTIEVPATRSARANVTNYQLKLENDELLVTEADENQGFSVHSNTYGEFDVRKDSEGRAKRYGLQLGKFGHCYGYYDLNGDGLIDVMYDPNTRETKILLDGRFVSIGKGRLDILNTEYTSSDGKTNYAFVGDHWTVKQ